ncbi:MAG TPA: hypothetical protein VFQ67_14190, partial [Allosphingosinicella sp.]|nr:hypothetical protein [Allosphingosinicella sp.]
YDATTTQAAVKIARVDVPIRSQAARAYGNGCFRIAADHRTENLPSGFCLQPLPDQASEAG